MADGGGSRALPSKQSTWNGWHLRISIKARMETTLAPITKLAQASLRLAHIPQTWAQARGVFIPKAGRIDLTNPKAYRLITLTSFLLKATERCALWHISENAGIQEAITPYQHGFIKGASTDSAIHTVVDKIEGSLADGEFALGIFLDIKGAFDNAPFEAIVEQLRASGVQEGLIKWMEALLRSRTVTFERNGAKMTRTHERGCPQGGSYPPHCGTSS